MKVLVVYCHPSANSFTHQVKEEFLRGLSDAGHSCEVSDLYKIKFDPVFSEEQYLRDGFYKNDLTLPEDVRIEHEKIQRADAIAFLYPVFWTEAPALLTGWFQRVWSYGFAYGEQPLMKTLEKALFLVTMGGSLSDPLRQIQVEAMKTVMLGDRINTRAQKKEMVFFDGMSRGDENDEQREYSAKHFLKEAFRQGISF